MEQVDNYSDWETGKLAAIDIIRRYVFDLSCQVTDTVELLQDDDVNQNILLSKQKINIRKLREKRNLLDSIIDDINELSEEDSQGFNVTLSSFLEKDRLKRKSEHG